MKIIIAGAGEVGFHLAKLLSYESQEITLIDTDKDSLAYADTHLDIKVVRGDATSIAILKESNVANCELFIAVTASETTNITVCVLAKQLGAKKTIARITNTEFINHKDEVGFTKFGIDELISPESLAASEIELSLKQSSFNDTYEFEGGALTMIGLNLSKSASFVGKTVKEAAKIFPELHFVPIAIQRFGNAFIAVGANSETNIMSCLVAKSKGVKKSVALVENMDYFELSHSVGIETLINKKLLAANNIFRYIRKGEVVAMTKLSNMNAELLEFEVKATSAICNKYIKNINFPRSAIIGGIVRDGEGVIALGDFKIQEGDRVVVCSLLQSIKGVEKLFR